MFWNRNFFSSQCTIQAFIYVYIHIYMHTYIHRDHLLPIYVYIHAHTLIIYSLNTRIHIYMKACMPWWCIYVYIHTHTHHLLPIISSCAQFNSVLPENSPFYYDSYQIIEKNKQDFTNYFSTVLQMHQYTSQLLLFVCFFLLPRASGWNTFTALPRTVRFILLAIRACFWKKIQETSQRAFKLKVI